MDCKKFSRLIGEVDGFDENLLTGQAKSHLSQCVTCKKEVEWLNAVQGDLKSFKLPDPGQKFFEDLTSRVHIKLMTGTVEKEKTRKSWFAGGWDWFGKPSFAYGLSAAAVAVVLLLWGVPTQQGLHHVYSSAAAPTAGGSQPVVTYASAPIGSYDQADLSSLSEPELRAAMRALIKKSFDRNDVESLGEDPVSVAERDTYLSNDLNQLDRQGLRTVSYLLNQRYPH